jgi:hypothetical protein
MLLTHYNNSYSSGSPFRLPACAWPSFHKLLHTFFKSSKRQLAYVAVELAVDQLVGFILSLPIACQNANCSIYILYTLETNQEIDIY